MIQVKASSEEVSLLRALSETYSIGFSCNCYGQVWGCTRHDNNKPADRGPLPEFALLTEFVACVLSVYPNGARVRLCGSILYKCEAGEAGYKPLIRIVSCALPRSAWELC